MFHTNDATHENAHCPDFSHVVQYLRFKYVPNRSLCG